MNADKEDMKNKASVRINLLNHAAFSHVEEQSGTIERDAAFVPPLSRYDKTESGKNFAI